MIEEHRLTNHDFRWNKNFIILKSFISIRYSKRKVSLETKAVDIHRQRFNYFLK